MKKTQRLRIATAATVLMGACCATMYAQTAAPAPAQKATPAPATSAATPAASPAATQKPTPASPAPAQARAVAAPVVPPGVPTPPDYVIGADDILTIVFWREKDMSGDVSVRPDGKISLPLINEVIAAGLTPEQLRLNVTEAAGKFVEDPAVTVVVKAINSRKVFIMGQVGKPGPFALGGPTTVLQLLATAGGVGEYSKSDKIVIMRTENGKSVSHKFNYKDVVEGKNLQQNIELKPGDTIIVP